MGASCQLILQPTLSWRYETLVATDDSLIGAIILNMVKGKGKVVPVPN
jgi:hypothetical protein